MLPPKTTVLRTVPAIGSAPRQALALLVGDLQVAVDVDDLLGTQPLGEAVGAAERLTSGQRLRWGLWMGYDPDPFLVGEATGWGVTFEGVLPFSLASLRLPLA